MNKLYRHCIKCLLPEQIPGADIDECGICYNCRHPKPSLTPPQETVEKLERILRNIKGSHKGKYDGIVTLSGGKDSTYLLYKLAKEYNLRILAFTVNVALPETALENIYRTVRMLKVEHILYVPDLEFHKKLFNYLLRNQKKAGAEKTVCDICSHLVWGYAAKFAAEKKIPFLFSGYGPGQFAGEMPREPVFGFIPTEGDFAEISGMRKTGFFSEEDLRKFWNSADYPAEAIPVHLAPLQVWEYHQSKIMDMVDELGLVVSRKKANPVCTNCEFIWFFMYSDLKKLGYISYNENFSQLIREGKASKFEWLFILPILKFAIRHKLFWASSIKKIMKMLEISDKDLRITGK